MEAIHLTVKGRVQAVGFRAFIKRHAELLGITGWVKNCNDGCVEIFAEGSKAKLKQLEELCAKGPPNAEVEKITMEPSSTKQSLSFEILR